MKPPICKKNTTFQQCELAILRQAIDLAGTKISKRLVSSPEVQKMLIVVEDFLKKKNLICYGGTAINALLPEEDKFYNSETVLSDYDFFSANALEDAKELADIFFKKGFKEVEAKSGLHHGTYKVFVEFLPMADITFIPKELFNALKKDSIRVNGILYCPPNYLRMSMYLELSRPAGDVGRWEKVLKRLTLLNKHYPFDDKKCGNVNFQREMVNDSNENQIYETVKNTFIHQGCVFFGGYAISTYSQYMPKTLKKKLQKIPDFDVLSNDPESTCEIVKERLKDVGEKNVKIISKDPISDVIPEHFEIKVNGDTIAFVYKPVGCHSYNTIEKDGEKVKIATIDTMLSFYLAFLYADRPYYDKDRIVCMAKYLFDVQQKNRLEQKGVLRRFTVTCYGHQETIEEIRGKKANKFKELFIKPGAKALKEFQEWFLNYNPESSKSKIVDEAELESESESDSDSDSQPETESSSPVKYKKYSKKYKYGKKKFTKRTFSRNPYKRRNIKTLKNKDWKNLIRGK